MLVLSDIYIAATLHSNGSFRYLLKTVLFIIFTNAAEMVQEIVRLLVLTVSGSVWNYWKKLVPLNFTVAQNNSDK